MRIGPVGINDIFPSSVSMGSSLKGTAIDVSSAYVYAFILKWSGSPVGNMYLQVSNYVSVGNESPPDSSFTIDTGSLVAITTAGEQFYNVNTLGYRWARIVWERTSGTGAFTLAQFNSKGV